MINSLVSELERYRFDEDGARFEEHLKTLNNSIGHSCIINMEEESYL